MEKSKIILHEENCNEKNLEYFISELAPICSGLSQFDLKSVAGLELNLGPGAVRKGGIGSILGQGAQHCTHTHTEPISSSKPLQPHR